MWTSKREVKRYSIVYGSSLGSHYNCTIYEPFFNQLYVFSISSDDFLSTNLTGYYRVTVRPLLPRYAVAKISKLPEMSMFRLRFHVVFILVKANMTKVGWPVGFSRCSLLTKRGMQGRRMYREYQTYANMHTHTMCEDCWRYVSKKTKLKMEILARTWPGKRGHMVTP